MIILNVDGQTCNKLFVYRNFIAKCLELEDQIIVFAPDITIKYFPNLIDRQSVIRFPFYYNSLFRFIPYEKYISLFNLFFGNRIVVNLLESIFKIIPGINFVNTSIGEYSNKNKRKYDNEVREILSIDRQIRDEVDLTLEKVKSQTDIVCGVHIRYGDYRSWQDGKYFFTIEQYNLLMQSFINLFPDKTVTFLVASNEVIDLNSFRQVKCLTIDNGSAIKDLYGLSQCDFIFGPPSSFSGWASFYGNVPLYFIEDIAQEISHSCFKNISDIWS